MNYKSLISEAHDRIKPFIHNTPVLTSTLINNKVGAELFFKCENLQRMGAFKIRGATNAALQLSDEEKKRGLVTHSSGNMAQAVALAARSLNIPAYIVMPENAPKVKVNAVIDYGGNITFCKSTIEARTKTANEIIREKGASFIHPFNDHQVVFGQATAAKELLESQADLNIIVAPVGGGGLASGTSLTAKYFGKNCICIGAEPEIVDDAFRSLESGSIQKNDRIDTIADGLRTNLGPITFEYLSKYLDKVITVTEEEIISAMKLIWERMKIIVEPSCAVPLAAIVKNKHEFTGKKIGVILSGGNVDLNELPF